MNVRNNRQRSEAAAGTLGAALYQYPLMVTLLVIGCIGAGAVLATKVSSMALPAR